MAQQAHGKGVRFAGTKVMPMSIHESDLQGKQGGSHYMKHICSVANASSDCGEDKRFRIF
jgi:hypothetical protein